MKARYLLIIVLVAGSSLHAASAQPAPGVEVAVPDFYAPGPLPPVEGIIPEEVAANDLTALLSRGAGSNVRVVPREAVRRAEAALRWHSSDVLRFARLGDLGRAVNAGRLVVGRIDRLELDQGGNGGGPGGSGRHFMSGFAVITVQVFDVAQGRIISQVQQSASELGVVRGQVVERLLLHVLERAMTSLLPSP